MRLMKDYQILSLRVWSQTIVSRFLISWEYLLRTASRICRILDLLRDSQAVGSYIGL